MNYNPKTGKFKRSNRIELSKELVTAMYADYQAGLSFTQVGRKHGGRHGGTVREIFLKRNWLIRKSSVAERPHLKNGCWAPDPLKTPAQITAMIAKLKRLEIPHDLKNEWRSWPLQQRKAFIQRLRKKFPSTRPTTPFSANVEPFEYGSPKAHAIVAQMNKGLPSQKWVINLRAPTEGVIWNGKLFLWVEFTGYVSSGGWRPGIGRPMLNHVIWEHIHGKPVPPQMTVIHVDGNKNNFKPVNLKLRSMADCARMNAWHAPGKPVEVVKLALDRIHATRSVTLARRSRNLTSAMVQSFTKPDNKTALLTALQQRS